MIAAGLEGMRKKLDPPAPVNENIFGFSDEEAVNKGVSTLPGSLDHALHFFEKDELVKETLGEHTFRMFKAAKEAEWMEYKATVSAWELEKYLEMC